MNDAEYFVSVKYRNKETIQVEKFLSEKDYVLPDLGEYACFKLQAFKSDETIDDIKSNIRKAFENVGCVVSDVKMGIMQ
jgi:hypothetical protein